MVSVINQNRQPGSNTYGRYGTQIQDVVTSAPNAKSVSKNSIKLSHAAKESNNQPQNHVAEREASWGSTSSSGKAAALESPSSDCRTLS